MFVDEDVIDQILYIIRQVDDLKTLREQVEAVAKEGLSNGIDGSKYD